MSIPEWMRKKGFSEDWYEDSWCKWKGKLWERLKARLSDEDTVKFRKFVWDSALWHPCSYCERVFVCDECPLHEKGACECDLQLEDEVIDDDELRTTDVMFNAWLKDDYETFVKSQGQLLISLLETADFCKED
ncbi:MAG: hypothetical protein ACTSUO_06015 [Candidatus Thorarchaeota archaeon]